MYHDKHMVVSKSIAASPKVRSPCTRRLPAKDGPTFESDDGLQGPVLQLQRLGYSSHPHYANSRTSIYPLKRFRYL